MDMQPSSRRPAPSRRLVRAFMAVAFAALAAASVHGVLAQESAEPEAAIMARLAPHALALDATTADGALIAVGERGHILVSTDSGATWVQKPSPTRAELTAVYFADRQHGWAVGHDTTILRTSDGGESWELVHWAPEDEAPLFDVWFSDLDNGFALGAYGTFLVTSDGGETWDYETVSDDDVHLHNIARAADGRLYIAAEAGTAFRSDDDGVTWVSLPSPYEGSFFGVLPLGSDVVLLYGLRGHVFRSEDAGETWTPIDTGTVAMITDGVRLADGRIVLVGLGGAVLVSGDDGRTFSLHQQPNRRGISAVVETGEGNLLLAGEFGVKVASPDELIGAAASAER